ncbi:MAG: precorrin-3B synthase, partial [Candidatus Saccharibacteria bacterium]|nr:precorrin-3B synthase [Pseudorhodobacter sp.]
MSFVVKGWCPGALRPMMSGDGLLVRVRPRMARLTPVQVRGLAEASLAHGNGVIDLTARGNLQLRGVRADHHLALLDDLDALGLLDQDAASEQRQNVVVAPFWTAGDGTSDVVAVVLNVLAAPEFGGLPGKFGVSVDLARPVMQAVPSDIRIERIGQAWLVRPDGFHLGALVTNVEPALRQLLDWFLASGARRMADLHGQELPAGFACPAVVTPYQAEPGPQELGSIVGVAFGQVRAETLLALSEYAVRITPWRMLLIEGDCPDLPGLIRHAADPLLRVTACTGAPGCSQGLQPTRDLARDLASQVPLGHHLHVSGCAKGCAHPGVADVTLTATRAGFDLIRGGRAADVPHV